MMSLDNEASKVIQGRFHLIKKLGAGSFGEIFEAKDLKTGKLYACKAESLRSKHPQLRLEYAIYRALQNSKSFVRVWGFVTHYNHHIMIMDKLGESLEQLFTLCQRRFSIRSVCHIAVQILERIEELHNNNYLHRDIKPDNFLIGHVPGGDLTDLEGSKVYMIDLGLGKLWKENGRHIPEKHGKRLIGTPRYASINTHFGQEQSRRDDLESLGYMLMYFAHGHLPWQGLRGQTKEEKYQKIGQKKQETRLDELCASYPLEFREYLESTQKLGFLQEPPYAHYKALFRKVLNRERGNGPYEFDWQNKHYAKKIAVQAAMKRPRNARAAGAVAGQTTNVAANVTHINNIGNAGGANANTHHHHHATSHHHHYSMNVNQTPHAHAQHLANGITNLATPQQQQQQQQRQQQQHLAYNHSPSKPRQTSPHQQQQQTLPQAVALQTTAAQTSPQHRLYNNNQPLALPNLQHQQQQQNNTATMIPLNLSYIDRLQRARSLANANKAMNPLARNVSNSSPPLMQLNTTGGGNNCSNVRNTSNLNLRTTPPSNKLSPAAAAAAQISPHQIGAVFFQNANCNATNDATPRVYTNNNGHATNVLNYNAAAAANYNSTSLLCDYGELTTNYKKMEATNTALTSELTRLKAEFNRMRQESSLKDTENTHLRMQVNQLRSSLAQHRSLHEQQLLENKRIKDSLDALQLRNAAVAASSNQPAAKRRRLNSSAAANRM